MSRLLFLCPESPTPHGGIRKIYDFARTLNDAGRTAFVVHHTKGYRPEWFTPGAPALRDVDVVVRPDDILVLPEIKMRALVSQCPLGVTKFALVQGAYLALTTQALGSPAASPYRHPDVKRAIAVSEDNRTVLEYAFPWLEVVRVRLAIDYGLFCPAEKRALIAAMPRRGATELTQVWNILQNRGNLGEYHIDLILNASEREVAARLGAAAIYVATPLATGEGFPLPPFEAMSAGCVVTGFTGRGGAEYWRADHSFPVSQGDVVGLARTLEDLCARPIDELRTIGGRAAQWVRGQYGPEQERDDILRAFEPSAVPSTVRVSDERLWLPCLRPSSSHAIGHLYERTRRVAQRALWRT